MKDKYALAIEYLTEHPYEIPHAWIGHRNHKAGCLFGFATPNGTGVGYDEYDASPGCLTMIREARYGEFIYHAIGPSGVDEVLTKMIRDDSRIPDRYCQQITVADLPVFAEWQRKLDILIRGVEPSEPTEQTKEIEYDTTRV